MKVYLCGPMTGIPQFNFPLFDKVAHNLRLAGYQVVSPAEMDDPKTRKAAMASVDGAPGSGSSNGETWGDFLARDVKLLSDGGIEAIVLLPNWWQSRGATLETTVGLLNKLKFFQYILGSIDPLSNASVISGLLEGWHYRGTMGARL